MAVGGYLRGERVAVAIPLAILAFIALTEIYHRYRRRTSPPEGPPDPSYDWDRDLKEPDRSPVQVFRYDKATLAALLVGMALYPLLPAAFYIVSIPHPTGIGLLACILAGVLPTLGILLCYMSYRKFSVEVHASYLAITGLRATRRIDFSTVANTRLFKGFGRGPAYILTLFDAAGKPIIKFTPDIVAFKQLTVLVKNETIIAGGKYRYVDVWGNSAG